MLFDHASTRRSSCSRSPRRESLAQLITFFRRVIPRCLYIRRRSSRGAREADRPGLNSAALCANLRSFANPCRILFIRPPRPGRVSRALSIIGAAFVHRRKITLHFSSPSADLRRVSSSGSGISVSLKIIPSFPRRHPPRPIGEKSRLRYCAKGSAR